MYSERIINSIKESRNGLDNMLNDHYLIKKIEFASTQISETINQNSKIFACGNGGSMCDAMHFAEELSGRFRENRRGLPAISISDPSFITCVANDFGFENVFSRFLEANAQKNDLLIAISTSGKSKNILRACEFCKENGVSVISLTGRKNSEVSKYSDIDICTQNGKYSDRVQELHTLIIHILVELVEDLMF
jgi:D-sedoheptulose 7-phosphate isomerase